MKKILLISSDPSFFEQKNNAINRRATRVFGALNIDEAKEALEKIAFDLIIVSYSNSSQKPGEIYDEINALHKQVKCPMILVIKEVYENIVRNMFKEQPDIFLVMFPISYSYLMELSKKLLKQSQRKYIRLLIQIKMLTDDGMSKTFFGFSRNISDSGMLFETETDLTVDDVLFFSFMAPGTNKMVEVKGQVVRLQRQKGSTVKYYGLRYLDIAPADRTLLSEYVKKM